MANPFVLGFPAGTKFGSNGLSRGGYVGSSNGASGVNPAQPGERVYDTPGTYTLHVSAGMVPMWMECLGGGGAGGGQGSATAGTANIHGGYGGAGGGLGSGQVGGGLLTPGVTLTITVGAAGVASTGDGTDGGFSQVQSPDVTPLIRAGGGKGGVAGSFESEPAAAGGTVTIDGLIAIDVVNVSGANGGKSAPNGPGGNGGVSGAGGTAGLGGAPNKSGTAATDPGCGGGGIGAWGTGAAPVSGAGAAGHVRIVWPPPG